MGGTPVGLAPFALRSTGEDVGLNLSYLRFAGYNLWAG